MASTHEDDDMFVVNSTSWILLLELKFDFKINRFNNIIVFCCLDQFNTN
jgi:hypothetical protein